MNNDEREERVDLDKWDAIQWMLNVFSNGEFTFAQKVEALEDYQRRAATRMRQACVEKINELTEPERRKLQFGTGVTGQRSRDRIRFSNEIIAALESLTLDSTEQKEEP